MLNRLFIAIGVLVILAIGAAFIVPRFIQWGDYRERLQTMAAEAFGTEVTIGGDIQLTLLPAPKLEFTKVRVGPSAAPVLEVGQVDAELLQSCFGRGGHNVFTAEDAEIAEEDTEETDSEGRPEDKTRQCLLPSPVASPVLLCVPLRPRRSAPFSK